ncbi:MAG: DUF3048 domain-containing protein [Chloroflexi bacterium]|nr:MAG: DUF3048 domain-containing protein [Chloroflexota bacterium]MBL1194586.1 DUF3048 domain-containing protein [Chloroflexota bacterium]NOH11875.1 DUF3048 domain-containing protein [Chloroflexota bacterium]
MLKKLLITGLLLGLISLAFIEPGQARPAENEVQSFTLQDTTPTPTPQPQATPIVAIPLLESGAASLAVGPEVYPVGVNPLTGLTVADPALLERRPIVVKITNYPRSVRPQSGVSVADHVYEYYIERGITRFVAVFYGTDADKAGPVRSGRFFDEHVFRMYDGFFVFGYADSRIMDYFNDLGQHIENSFVLESPADNKITCQPNLFVRLCRDRSIDSYNNLFANTAALTHSLRFREQYRAALAGQAFSPSTPQSSQLGLELRFRYSSFIDSYWQYDEDLGKYLRFQEEIGFSDVTRTRYVPHSDALTGQQITADNVVALIVPHSYYIKTNTVEIIDIDLTGAGLAYVFRDGFAYPVIWQRTASGPLQLVDADGNAFPMKPGNTFYQVISEETAVNDNGARWEFLFSLEEFPWGGVTPEAPKEGPESQ